MSGQCRRLVESLVSGLIACAQILVPSLHNWPYDLSQSLNLSVPWLPQL